MTGDEDTWTSEVHVPGFYVKNTGCDYLSGRAFWESLKIPYFYSRQFCSLSGFSSISSGKTGRPTFRVAGGLRLVTGLDS